MVRQDNYASDTYRQTSFTRITGHMFHVKPYEASEAETNTFVSISEPIKVGHKVSKHTQGESSGHTCVDIAEPQYVGLRCNRSPNITMLSPTYAGVLLNSDFYSVFFGVEDYAFVIPVSSCSGLPRYSNAVVGHLLG